MRVALAIAAVLAVATSAAAQTETPTIDRPVPARLTLQEALSRAIETSHILAELRAREGAATAVLDQRKASDMPVVSGGVWALGGGAVITARSCESAVSQVWRSEFHA